MLGEDEDSGLFGGGPPKVCGLFRWNTGLAGDSPLGFTGSKPSTSAGVPCGDIDGAFGARVNVGVIGAKVSSRQIMGPLVGEFVFAGELVCAGAACETVGPRPAGASSTRCRLQAICLPRGTWLGLATLAA